MTRMREGEDGVYLVEHIALEKNQVPDELKERLTQGYEPFLRIAMWYARDANPRGLKLSIVRMMRDERSEVSVLTAKHNGFMTLLELPRKNERLGRLIAYRIRDEKLDEIRDFALGSMEPKWRDLRQRLTAWLRETVDA